MQFRVNAARHSIADHFPFMRYSYRSEEQMLNLQLRSTATLLFLIFSLALAACSKQNSSADETNAIRQMLNQQVADWNKHDLDGFASGYWRSPDLVFQSGTSRTNGWDGMRDRYRNSYQSEGKEMGHLDFTNVEINVLSSDSAFVRGHWQLTMSDGKQPGGLFTLILRKFPEG